MIPMGSKARPDLPAQSTCGGNLSPPQDAFKGKARTPSRRKDRARLG